MTNQRFIELSNGSLIDLSQVEMVSAMGGEMINRRYAVSFRSGANVEICENRDDFAHMRRQEFVDKLLNQNTQTMNQIVVRHAKDDFDALLTAQGFEDAGATVISISLNHTKEPDSTSRFLVFARYDSTMVTVHLMDHCINRSLSKGN